jgi:hypothetical protein
VNSNGGSHIMHLYESSELGSTEDSLELIEWGPLTGVTVATTYPNYRIWCGLTSKAAPLTPLTGSMLQGLNAVFDTNYTLTPYQTGITLQPGCTDPTAVNPRKVPCGGPAAYTVMLQTTAFYPYPLLSPCFEFSTSTGMSGSGVNLVFEQDIVAGNQLPNFNRYRATFFNPVRRLIDRPINEVTPPGFCPNNQGGQFDVYRHRFTFCGLVAQCRSLWYDTGTANPNYINFIVSPPVTSQPPGTQSTWILEGTDTPNPQPSTTGSQGVFIDANGTINPSVLSSTISGLRFFRFRVELRGDNATNAVPAYSSASMAYAF